MKMLSEHCFCFITFNKFTIKSWNSLRIRRLCRQARIVGVSVECSTYFAMLIKVNGELSENRKEVEKCGIENWKGKLLSTKAKTKSFPF